VNCRMLNCQHGVLHAGTKNHAGFGNNY